MKSLSRTFNVFGELSHLGRMLFTDGMHFLFLCAGSRIALAADNLFLRKHLAFYQARATSNTETHRPPLEIDIGAALIRLCMERGPGE